MALEWVRTRLRPHRRETGIMRKIEREPNGAGIFRPGQDLVVAGTIGKNGVRAALSAKEKEISARFPEWFVKRIREQADKKLELTPEMFDACGAGEWEEISEGGILAALWTISGAYEQGISFELRKIPVAQETIEICELFDLNPYRLASGECLLMAVENGGDAVRILSEAGIPSAVIGKVEKGIARKMTGIGTTGFLERPAQDEIYKITGECV